MKRYAILLITFFSLSEAGITRFMTFAHWNKDEKIDFAKRCLWTENIQKLDIHLGEIKCVDTANVLSAVYPRYEVLAQMDRVKFNQVIEKYLKD